MNIGLKEFIDAYDGEQFARIADDIMKANCMTWAIVEDMHPMI